MSFVVIPLTSDPDQNFNCTIPVDGKNIELSLRIKLNTVGNYWTMSISDPKTAKLILDNIPLFCGVYPSADLLKQYSYLGLGTAVIINTGNSVTDSPDGTSLGTKFVLVWGDTVV